MYVYMYIAIDYEMIVVVENSLCFGPELFHKLKPLSIIICVNQNMFQLFVI